MSSLVIVRVRIVSSASAGKASMVLVAMTLANAMILVDQTAVPIALPDIMNGFHVGSQKVQWVLSCSLLPLAGLLVLGGKLGDLLGRRRVFLTGAMTSSPGHPPVRRSSPRSRSCASRPTSRSCRPAITTSASCATWRRARPTPSCSSRRMSGAVAGTVTFVPAGGPLGEIAGPDETEFRMLAVDPAARGRGVGTALLQKILDASRSRDGVVCSSLPEMRAAHRIYERLGFRRVPGRDWSPVPGIDLLTFVFNAR